MNSSCSSSDPCEDTVSALSSPLYHWLSYKVPVIAPPYTSTVSSTIAELGNNAGYKHARIQPIPS